MNAAAGTNRTVNRQIKLLHYQPPSGGASRSFGAVWRQVNEVRWTSPIIRRLTNVLDPELFVDRFPEATYDFDHFSAAITRLASICSDARELLDVAEACQVEAGLGLSCVVMKGQIAAETSPAFWKERTKRSLFAQLKSALPLRLTNRVLATGMRLPHIANGLVRLVWDTPLSP